ncbi:MAG: hypothetical protein ACJ8AP_13245 [Gemmatimonadales bacterium]
MDSTFVLQAEIDSMDRGPGAKKAYWAPYRGSEYIYLSWNDRFTGMFARVRLKGSRLEGPSFEFSDAGPKTWRRGVISGGRIECGSPRMHGAG